MAKHILNETFESSRLTPQLNWHCEPLDWKLENGGLRIATDAKTDFWQRTHYGFQVDNGHFLYMEVEGDFVMETGVSCKFQHQYDQAGLMVRVSDQCWIKTSVEFEPDEPNKLGAVVTNHGYSDWSTQDVSDDFTKFRLRISRKSSDYTIQYFSEKTNEWIQIRLFHLHDQPSAKAGLYCCSPKKDGFNTIFQYLKIS